MRYAFILERDGDGWLVRFPDVPEALTAVRDPDAERNEIADCLVTALAAYASNGESFPRASSVADAAGVVDVPALIQAKLALMRAMTEEGIGLRALARRLGVDPRQVHRLLDLDHRSHINAVERALAALGRRIEISACAA